MWAKVLATALKFFTQAAVWTANHPDDVIKTVELIKAAKAATK